MKFNTTHRRCCRSAALALFALLAVSADARAVSVNWNLVSNPGNAADPATGSNYGAVGYSYNIGKYDVTVSQYVEFLNSKDSSGANTLGLYNRNLSIHFNSGSLPGSKYSGWSGRESYPVNLVSWFDSIRFANWLNNGQGNGDTETGAYTLLGGTPTPSNGNTITRNAGARVFLPNENEWYKAAYYNPGTNSYYQYPTSSNTAPTGSGPTALPNHANFEPGGPGYLTDVGAYSGTTSPYGAFDMAGNVLQWNDTIVAPPPNPQFQYARVSRGGAFQYNPDASLSSFWTYANPDAENQYVGFRLASIAGIPEPSTGVLAVIACGTMWWWRKRFK